MRDHLRRAETTPGGYEIRYEVQSRYARCVTDEMPEGEEDEKPYTLCPRCREKVEPSDEDVRRAALLPVLRAKPRLDFEVALRPKDAPTSRSTSVTTPW